MLRSFLTIQNDGVLVGKCTDWLQKITPFLPYDESPTMV